MTYQNTHHVYSGSRHLWVLLLFLSHPMMAGEGRSPAFTDTSARVSNDGHVYLQWIAISPGTIYEIQQAETPDFHNSKSIYKGPDLGTFISGLPSGNYYYRVRAEGSEWSETVKLEVKHHSLRLAYTLTGVGALVFLLTVLVVVRGTIETKVTD